MDYEKAYNKALERAKKMHSQTEFDYEKGMMEEIFPELGESEDEKVRKELIQLISCMHDKDPRKKDWLAWLEKQGNNNSQNWKPSKEEMEVLYGLAYITNQYDEHKEEVVTRLYQDLKREFFNGSSYENMFPNTEDDVRRRSTIQVLEYARSLDTYNQYGKADIDKNIAWLEKQGQEPKKVSIWKHWKDGIAGNGDGKPIYLIKNGYAYSLSSCLSFECDYIELSDLDNLLLEKQGEQKDIDKVEPKFKVGDWIIDKESKEVFYLSKNLANTYKIVDIEGNDYHVPHYTLEEDYDVWTIQDAKDGDVLACGDKVTDCPFIFHNLTEKQNPRSYCGIDTLGEFQVNDENGGFWCYSNEVRPATKEQRDLLFSEMKEAGYEWNPDKKELKKIEDEIEIPFGAKDSELQEVTYYIPKGFHAEIDDDKVVIKKGEKTAEWSEDDEEILKNLIDYFSLDDGLRLPTEETIDWLKSLKQRING